MATYGLRVINDESELLIDSEYISPTFTQKLEFFPNHVSEEAGTSYLHSGYVKREYRTASITTAGNYIVMWTLPENGTKDVWYNFESSTVNGSGYLTLYVYANSLGDPLTYYLPTAYVFAVSNLPASSGYGLQLFNSAGTKTYDSNSVQLAPYAISDSFTFWDDPTGTLRLPAVTQIPVPTNPIFMLPNYTSLRVLRKYSGSTETGHLEFVYEPMFKREGSNINVLEVQSYYSDESDTVWEYSQTSYNSGNRSGLGIIVADADLYAAPAPQTGTGSNPQYLLTSSVTGNVNEGTTVTVTLSTVNVANGSTFGYVVTGIAAADLSAGSLTGNFIIQNNNATTSFTFANDLLLEGTEVFTLSITNTSLSVTLNVQDTSTPTPVYSFSTVSSINEGTSGSTTFNATSANGKVVTFAIVAPVSGNTVDGLDGTLNTTTWTVPSNAQSSIAVSYTAAGDYYTEGVETFRLAAIVDGLTVATSNAITVNDTSTTTISTAATWQESSSNNVTITSTGPIGGTLYLTTSNSLVTPSVSSVYVDSAAGPLNPTGFSTTISYTAGIVTANTAVELYVRTGSATGRIVAQTTITLTNVGESYSFGGVSALNEGASGSVQFNYSYAANKAITFAIVAPSAGTTANTPADVTLSTTSFTVGNTNASGSTSVSFSAVSDSTTEGAEAFRISATVSGTTYYSDNITINDSSVSPPAASITVADSWSESSTVSVTIGATNANGVTLYLTTSNSLITPSVSTITPNSASYSTNINYTTGIVTTNTSVTIYVRTGSAAGTILASKVITVTNTAASYSFSTVSWLNEGQSGSNVFNFSNAANKTITFALAAPPAGYTSATLGTDVTISTTSYTVGSTNAAGTVTVNYATTADATTEGGEYFRLSATVDGSTYYSEPIYIYDTSLSPSPTFSIVPNLTSWADATNPYIQANYLGTISATNYTGQGLYLTTNNALVNPGVVQHAVTSNSWSTQVNWGVQEFSATTTVQLQLRTGSTSGPIVATANVTVVNTPPAPSYSISGMSSSVGYNSSFNFNFNATNANGKATTVSIVPATNRITVSPTSFTINSNSFTQSITVTGVPQGSAQAQTSGVVIRFTNPDGTLDSSSFNILAEPAPTSVPTIVSIAPTSSEYFPGENVEAIITFSGPITAGTYVRVVLVAGSYGTIWYPGSASAVAPPGNANIVLTIGATDAYFVGLVNQGIYQVNNATLQAAIVSTTSGAGTYTSFTPQSAPFKLST